MPPLRKTQLIAACGMNCALCLGFQRDKDTCPGCRAIRKDDAKYCRKCIIKNCQILKKKKLSFCSDKCEKFPCKRLKDLDKRYKTKYHMSMVENLTNIQKIGIREFVKKQGKKYTCSKCKKLLCIHRDFCLNCKK